MQYLCSLCIFKEHNGIAGIFTFVEWLFFSEHITLIKFSPNTKKHMHLDHWVYFPFQLIFMQVRNHKNYNIKLNNSKMTKIF